MSAFLVLHLDADTPVDITDEPGFVLPVRTSYGVAEACSEECLWAYLRGSDCWPRGDFSRLHTIVRIGRGIGRTPCANCKRELP